MIDAYICVHHHHHNHQNKNHHNILQHHHTPSFLQCLRRRVNRPQKRPKQDHKRKLPVTLFFGNSFFKTVYNSLLLILFVKQKIVRQVCISSGFDKYLTFQSFWTVVSSHNRHVSIKNDKKYFPTLRGRVRLLAEQLAFKARGPLRQQSGRWPMFFLIFCLLLPF